MIVMREQQSYQKMPKTVTSVCMSNTEVPHPLENVLNNSLNTLNS